MSRLFPFVQFEFTHAIGPPPGFYVVRGGEAGSAVAGDASGTPDLASADVLSIRATAAAPIESRFRRTRAKSAAADAQPRDVPLSLVTVVRGTRMFSDAGEAEGWLTVLRRSEPESERWAEEALDTVNDAIAAYRACAADPYVIEVGRADARATVVGWGTAEEVRLGAWSEAVTVPPAPAPRLSRGIKLMPVQGLAAVLAGQGEVLEGETLLLRVLMDLRHGRPRAAAVGLDAAWMLLRTEITDRADATTAMEALPRIVERARSGALEAADVRTLEEMAEQAGILVDKWRYEPLGLA